MRLKLTITAAALGATILLGGCTQQSATVQPGYPAYFAARQRHDAAAQQIEQLGGSVRQINRGAAVVIFLDDPEAMKAAIALLPDVIDLDTLDLVTRSNAPWALEPLEKTPLRHLTLSGGVVDKRTAASLAKFTTLHTLNLIGAQVGDAQLAALGSLENLHELTLSFNPVTDAGLKPIASLPNLSVLRLRGTNVTQEATQRLRDDRPRLKIEIDHP